MLFNHLERGGRGMHFEGMIGLRRAHLFGFLPSFFTFNTRDGFVHSLPFAVETAGGLDDGEEMGVGMGWRM